jgi:HTH-type transcriptional regulator, competence development regulator
VKLQKLLAEARRAKGVSLRQVERATGVSNAYLSQMETGQVAEPSPRKLQTLAEYYGVPYDTLMNSCGYSVASSEGKSPDPGRMEAGTFMGEELTAAEAASLAKFLGELRGRPVGTK